MHYNTNMKKKKVYKKHCKLTCPINGSYHTALDNISTQVWYAHYALHIMHVCWQSEIIAL